MAWLSATSKGDEYGLMENIIGYAAIDQHYVIHPHLLYLHFPVAKDAERIKKMYKEFSNSEGPDLRGNWLIINTRKDYPEVLQLLPNAITKNYRVESNYIKSYGVVHHGPATYPEKGEEAENFDYDEDYDTIYIQFYNDKDAEEVKDLLEKKYGVQSRIARLGKKV
jgi:hypothetical protein